MKAPTVSVLMPVYNARRYVAEAVESILAQTFDDFELLIVDDGSTDRSLNILKKYASMDARIHLVSRPNTGYVVALNEMIKRAQGEFIARMDADDISLPDRFKKQVEFLRNHPRVGVVGGAYELIDDRGRLLTIRRLFNDNARIQDRLLSGDTHLAHPSVMMRRSLLQQVGGYDASLMPTEDLDLWLRLGEITELANLPDILIRYREHIASISTWQQGRPWLEKREACRRAWQRRGIEARPISDRPYRAGLDRDSQFEFVFQWAWIAYMQGRHRMAIAYVWKCLRRRPASRASWGLFRRVAVRALLCKGPFPGHDDGEPDSSRGSGT